MGVQRGGILGAAVLLVATRAGAQTEPAPAEAPAAAPVAPAPVAPAPVVVVAPPQAAAAPAAAPPAEQSEEEREDKKAEGMFGPIRLGGVVGIGLSTRPVSFTAMLKIKRIVVLGAEYSVLPKLTFATVAVKAYQIGADIRLLPFQGAFFVGAGFGYQALTARSESAIAPGALEIGSPFITPRFGWLFVTPFALTLGFDIGVVIPFGANTTGVADQDTQDTGDTFGNIPFPDIKLRIGLLF
jgi:hypothetical protein